MVKTNNVQLKINYNNIIRDFDIYKIGQELNGMDKKQRRIIQNVMNNLSDELPPALAMLYRYGGYLYAVFDKGRVTLNKLDLYIHGVTEEEAPGINVSKVDLTDLNSIYPNDLCQLFCNMIPNMETLEQYNNISGRLYYFNDDSFKKNVVTAYKISIEPLEFRKQDYAVTIKAESYYRLPLVLKYNEKDAVKIKSLPRYWIDPEDATFKRATTKVDEKQCFVRKSPGSKKNSNIAKDLDIKNIKSFKNSKKGMLYNFFKDFEECFSEYIQINLVDLKEENILKSYESEISENVQLEMFNRLGINIIDTIDDALSKSMIDTFVLMLNKKGINNVGYDRDRNFNIVLVHEPDYYSKHNMQDVYRSDLLTQHLTYENCINDDNKIEINKNVISKILNELSIKYDVANKHITLFNWNFDDVVDYVTVESVYNEQTKKNDDHYTLLRVYPNAHFEIKRIEDPTSDEFNYYKQIFRDDLKKKFSSLVIPEMLISYKNVVLLIDDTGIVVLPDLEEIHFRLINYNKNNEISTNELKKLLVSFIKAYPEYENTVLMALKEIENLNKESYQYQEVVNNQKKADNENYLKPLISLAKPIGRDFVQFCRKNYKIVFNPCLKSDVVNIFQHINILNGDYNQIVSYYYVGKKDTMQYNLHTSCHIRRITVLAGNADEKFLDLIYNQLRVDFIRNGEYTVLPFVKKYINEFYKLDKN